MNNDQPSPVASQNSAADPDAEEAENAPGAVMEPTSSWNGLPVAQPISSRRLVGEEAMGNEADRQADDADAEHQRVEQQDVNDAVAASAAPC